MKRLETESGRDQEERGRKRDTKGTANFTWFNIGFSFGGGGVGGMEDCGQSLTPVFFWEERGSGNMRLEENSGPKKLLGRCGVWE